MARHSKHESDDNENDDDVNANVKMDVRFGWEKLAGLVLPFVFRRDGKYCSLRMIETAMRDRLQSEAEAAASARAVAATASEAKLLDEINSSHRGRFCGPEPFLAGDRLLELNDARSLIEFLNDCHRICLGASAGDDNKYGLIRINGAAVIPYAKIAGDRHVPLFYFESATGVEPDSTKLERKRMDVWDRCYVEFCRRIIGKVGDDRRSEDDCFVDLLNVTPYLSFYAEVEEFWPLESVCNRPLALEDDFHEVQPVETINEECNKKYEIRQKRRYVRRNRQNQNLNNSKENNAPTEVDDCDISNMNDSNGIVRNNSSETEETLPVNLRVVKLKRTRETAKQLRQNETPEQREKRLMRLRLYQAKRLANETPEQREKRLAKLRLYNSLKKMNRHKVKVTM